MFLHSELFRGSSGDDQRRASGLAGLALTLALLPGLAIGRPAAAATDTPESASSPASGSADEEKVQAQKKQGKTLAGGHKQPAPARAGAPARPPDPPLTFTDDDLKRMFHRPAPAEEAATDDEVDGPPNPVVKVPARPASVKPAATATDPLKATQDRAALEKFRREQIEQLRSKIAEAQARLDYLNAKKGALETPAGFLQSGRTVAPPKPSIAPGKPSGPAPGFFPNLPPAQTDDDKEADAKLKPKELLEKIDEEIKTVDENLADLKSQLVRIETRFQAEAGGR